MNEKIFNSFLNLLGKDDYLVLHLINNDVVVTCLDEMTLIPYSNFIRCQNVNNEDTVVVPLANIVYVTF